MLARTLALRRAVCALLAAVGGTAVTTSAACIRPGCCTPTHPHSSPVSDATSNSASISWLSKPQ